jgi:hypothetical protein
VSGYKLEAAGAVIPPASAGYSDCALCRTHADVTYRRYMGHTIRVGRSWITGTRCYHALRTSERTLAGIKRVIAAHVESGDCHG